MCGIEAEATRSIAADNSARRTTLPLPRRGIGVVALLVGRRLVVHRLARPLPEGVGLAPHGLRLQQPYQAEHDHPEQDRDEGVSLGGAEDVRREQNDELVGKPHQGAGDDQRLPAA